MKELTFSDFEKRKTPLTIKELHDFELKHNVKLPDSYIEFMLKSNLNENGGVPKEGYFKCNENEGFDIISSSNKKRNIEVDFSGLESLMFSPKNQLSPLLIIGGDSGGNFICLSLSKENYNKVYFWDHEVEPFGAFDSNREIPFEEFVNIYFICNSFEEFVDRLETE